MDRRKTLKTLITGTLGATLVGTSATSCETPPAKVDAPEVKAPGTGYGMRLPHEIKHDERIATDSFFTEDELATLGILGNIICPGEPGQPKATETGLLEFLEFMALDIPDANQTIMRGGLAWLNSESTRRFGAPFAEISEPQRIEIVDDIAYPDAAEDTPMEPGSKFFEHMRYLTVTCYYTSRKGMFDVLGYQGNAPNVWDGVPEEVLAKHGKAYDPKYLPQYVNQDRRDEMIEWDEDKNVLNNF